MSIQSEKTALLNDKSSIDFQFIKQPIYVGGLANPIWHLRRRSIIRTSSLPGESLFIHIYELCSSQNSCFLENPSFTLAVVLPGSMPKFWVVSEIQNAHEYFVVCTISIKQKTWFMWDAPGFSRTNPALKSTQVQGDRGKKGGIFFVIKTLFALRRCIFWEI